MIPHDPPPPLHLNINVLMWTNSTKQKLLNQNHQMLRYNFSPWDQNVTGLKTIFIINRYNIKPSQVLVPVKRISLCSAPELLEKRETPESVLSPQEKINYNNNIQKTHSSVEDGCFCSGKLQLNAKPTEHITCIW